jgi:hypothetical protein
MLTGIRNTMSGLKPPAAGDIAFFILIHFRSPTRKGLTERILGGVLTTGSR